MRQVNKKILLWLIAILVPFIYTVSILIKGGIPFWYDPARDLLLGLDSLHKFTLLGPPSGIPGFFYGPYWVWLLGFALGFSKDPRVVSFVALVIPYFILFPLILYKFSKIYGKILPIALWLFFIFSFNQYAKDIWSPHLAPLITTAVVYLLITINYKTANNKEYFKILMAGFLTTLIIQFHISFGIVFSGATALFFLARFFLSLKYLKKYFIELFLFGLGGFITFIPTLIFEARHGFNQIKVFIAVFTYKYAYIGLWGEKKAQFFKEFFQIPSKILDLPFEVGLLAFVAGASLFAIFVIARKIKLVKEEINLLLLLLSFLIFFVYIFYSNKNPIWGYQLISVEVLVLLALGLFAARLRALRIVLYAWLAVFLILQAKGAFKKEPPAYSVSDLRTKTYITKLVIADDKGEPYSVKAYEQSILTYDFDYLFMWLDPNKKEDDKKVYLIIPEGNKHKDFISYETPPNKYSTEKSWIIPDGTIVIKRIKK